MELEVYIYDTLMDKVETQYATLHTEDISAVHVRSNVVCIYLTAEGEKTIQGELSNENRASATNDEPVGESEDTPNAV